MAYKELTKEIISDFDKYLRVEKGLSANTLWIYTMPLLSLTDKAWRRGIVRTDPFGEYSLEMQETDRGYLTEEELRTLANAVFVKKQTSLVRDMFLFGCFTGLSYIDIKTLTHDKIQRMDFDPAHQDPCIEQRPPHGDCQGADREVQGACRGRPCLPHAQ